MADQEAGFLSTSDDKTVGGPRPQMAFAKAEKAGLWVGYESPDGLTEATLMASKHKGKLAAFLKKK